MSRLKVTVAPFALAAVLAIATFSGFVPTVRSGMAQAQSNETPWVAYAEGRHESCNRVDDPTICGRAFGIAAGFARSEAAQAAATDACIERGGEEDGNCNYAYAWKSQCISVARLRVREQNVYGVENSGYRTLMWFISSNEGFDLGGIESADYDVDPELLEFVENLDHAPTRSIAEEIALMQCRLRALPYDPENNSSNVSCEIEETLCAS